MTDETLAANLMKQAAERTARRMPREWSAPKQDAWEKPPPPPPLPVSWNAPSFTTSNTTHANYYNAAATASGVR